MTARNPRRSKATVMVRTAFKTLGQAMALFEEAVEELEKEGDYKMARRYAKFLRDLEQVEDSLEY